MISEFLSLESKFDGLQRSKINHLFNRKHNQKDQDEWAKMVPPSLSNFSGEVERELGLKTSRMSWNQFF